MKKVIEIYDVGDKDNFQAYIKSDYSEEQLITILSYIVKDIIENKKSS